MRLYRSITDKMRFFSKKGSYLVEAAVLMPIVLLSLVTLVSIIAVIAECENGVYAACDEMKSSCIRQAFVKYDVSLPIKTKNRILSENTKVDSVIIKRCTQNVKKFGTDDVALINFEMCFGSDSFPVGCNRVNFDGKIMARAFSGKKYKGNPADADDFLKNFDSEKVYIFPKSGKKYHQESCRYMKPACKSVCLTRKIKRRWKTCSNCHSENIVAGSVVFCFPDSGRVYHSGDCSAVKKYYVEIERYYAEKKGFSQCSICF